MFRPIEFIKLYDDYEFLIDWKNKINNTNISDECSDETKRTLIESQFTPLNTIYNDVPNNVRNGVFYREKSLIGKKFNYSFYKNKILTNNNGVDKKIKKQIPLKTVNTNNFTNVSYLDCIQDYNGLSYFINRDANYETEAERFLQCFPYNVSGLLNTIKSGRRFIRLPFLYQLLLGRCIKEVRMQIEKGESHYLRDGYGFMKNFPNKTMEGINQLISYFFLLEDNTYTDSTWTDRQVLINDYLGLEEIYDKWVKGNKETDFKRLYNSFVIKPKLQNSNVDTEQMIRFLIQNASRINGRNTYAKLFKSSSLYQTCSDIMGSSFTTSKPKNVEEALDSLFVDFTLKYKEVDVDKDDLVLHFNDAAPGYNNLCDFIKKDSCLVMPYQFEAFKDDEKIPSSRYKNAFNAFKERILSYYKTDSGTTESQVDFSKMKSDDVTRENKLSMYLTLKNLYDKHLYNLDKSEELEKYTIDSPDSEYDRFHFIDSFYTDIGDKLIMNGEKINGLLSKIIGFEENGTGSGIMTSEMSLYSFMSSLCEINNMMLIAMPVFNGIFTGPQGDDSLERMFTPVSYNDSINEKPMKGPSYVCFYPHEPSYHLDIPSSSYADDGFNIPSDPYNNGDDIADTGNFQGPTSIRDLFTETDDYVIPAFGVEYGIQNQGIFKSVNVNMDNPQVTEQSVAAMFRIANMKTQEDVRKQNYIGQDLFKVYSNHSYTCTVEMMGCAQIQPLMYFQLTNIPMFRGAYMVIRVEHDIVAGNMTTTFTGVRINKNKIPMVTTAINLNDILDLAANGANLTGKTKTGNTIKFNGSLYGNLDNVNRYKDIPSINYRYNDIMNLNRNNKTVVKFETITSNNKGAEGAFNESNPELRKLVYGIAKRASESFGGIDITSMARTSGQWANKSSDHCIGNNVVQRRKELSGLNYLGNTTSFSEMGCAVDMLALNKNGYIDKQESSIALFDLIALDFTENIRQLIWEVRADACPSNNYVSNCIHLASYGHGSKNNDRSEIYVGLGNAWSSIKADNLNDISKAPTNLPPMFIKVLYRMALSGKDFNKIKFNNFPGIKLTKEILKKWCDELGV